MQGLTSTTLQVFSFLTYILRVSLNSLTPNSVSSTQNLVSKGVKDWGSQAYLAAFLAMKINSIMKYPRHSRQPCSSYSSDCTLRPSQMKFLNYFLIPECSQIHLASTISFTCNLIFISENPRWGMVTHPSIWKAEAVEPPQVWGQFGLLSDFQDSQGYNSEIMSQTKPNSYKSWSAK